MFLLHTFNSVLVYTIYCCLCLISMWSLTVLSTGPFPSFPHGSTGLQPMLEPTLAILPCPYWHAPSTYQITSSPIVLSPFPPLTGHSTFLIIDDSSCLLPTQVIAQVDQAIQNGWLKSTINHYLGAICHFIIFCDSLKISQSSCPADTPCTRLSALKAWHVAHNLEWKCSTCLHYVLSGVHNSAPLSSKLPPHPPISASMLSQLITSLDLTLPLDTAVAACACMAFWGQCYLGELLPTSSSIISSASFPTHSDLRRSAQDPDSCTLCLPCTKTHSHGEDIILVDQNKPINPISLLKNHIWVSHILHWLPFLLWFIQIAYAIDQGSLLMLVQHHLA